LIKQKGIRDEETPIYLNWHHNQEKYYESRNICHFELEIDEINKSSHDELREKYHSWKWCKFWND